MRRYSTGNLQRDNFWRNLKRIYEKTFLCISDYIYYAIILRGEYPFISDIFEACAVSECEVFRILDEMLGGVSEDRSLDIRARFDDKRGAVGIDKIIRLEAGAIREEIRECEYLSSFCKDKECRDILTRVIEMRGEMLERFERIMRS